MGIQCERTFLLGSDRSELHMFFWAQNIINIYDGTPSSCTPNLVYMGAGMSKDYKSSNRIKLSQFVQDLLHF